MTRYIASSYLFLCGSSLLFGQARYTASRAGDFQIGVDFVAGRSDYLSTMKGVGLYTTFDFTTHFGAEFDLRQGDEKGSSVYERTYEVGGRYYRNYGRAAPFAKIMVGRGVFNFADGNVTYANLAYNLVAIGGGADIRLKRYLNVRGEYEWQNWIGFPTHGLTPSLVTVGVSYHLPAGLARGRHY